MSHDNFILFPGIVLLAIVAGIHIVNYLSYLKNKIRK
jgi:hypothetical protein